MEWMQQFLSTPVEFLKNYGGPFVVALSVLVFVHEWGHYIIARLCGVKVETFSIGFGKELFGLTDKKGTRWKFCLIPLGGYVQMFGDVDPASARHEDGVKEGEKTRPFTAEEKKVAFYTQPIGKRSAIVFAGPAINYLFAMIVLTALYTSEGEPYIPPVAAAIIEGSPAAAAGIQPDDKIIAVNGNAITQFQELKGYTMINLDREMTLTVLHSAGEGKWKDDPVEIKVTPRIEMETDRFGFKHATGRIGIKGPISAFEVREHTPFSAFLASAETAWSVSVDSLQAIGQMIIGTRSAEELGGVLRIGAYAGQFAQEGWVSFVSFIAILSINLGLINILPIPMLDGGHLAMYAMERARGKPLTERVQEYALRVGVAFLICIMVFATWNDLVQLKVVDYVKNLIS